MGTLSAHGSASRGDWLAMPGLQRQGRRQARGRGRDLQRDLKKTREASMSEAVKETKAQRVERLKRELNPWEAYADIQRFAREGWDAVPPEWLGTYFRWWGIYTPGGGLGAIGGKGGGGEAPRHLLGRIRGPNGPLQGPHLRTIADLTQWHGRRPTRIP